MPDSTPPFEAGIIIADRYRVDAPLGEGGMSWVYRATDTHLDRPVALKVLREAAVHHSPRLIREARAAAALQHPAVVGIHDLGALDDGRPFIVLEFIEGQTLADRLADGPLDVAVALRLLRPVLAALAEAHAAGIVHRDLKPENLLLQAVPGGGEALRLLDFGIASIELEAGEDRFTQTGAVFGTPAFMAPEQALGRRASPATDVWALGAVLQTMLTGESPFAGKHAPEILFKVVQKSPARLSTPVPAHLKAAIKACLSKDPDDRPEDAGALAALLTAPVVAPTQTEPRWGLRRVAMLCAAGAFVGFVLGMLVSPRGASGPTAVARPAATGAAREAPASNAPPSDAPDAALAVAYTLVAEDAAAVLAWLDTHPEGDVVERQMLRARGMLADKAQTEAALAHMTAAVAERPGVLTADVIPALIAALNHRDGEPAVALLAQLWPKSREAVLAEAGEGRRRGRWRAVEVVEAADGDVNAARLAALLRDLKVGDCSQRERAGIALGKLGDPAAIPALRRANGRGLLDNFCMGSSLESAIYTLRKIEKAQAESAEADRAGSREEPATHRDR